MDLTYNGSEQELVTAGKASDGEIRYATGTATGAGGSYSTSIPKGTEAGDYYVWYKAVGDAAHNDSEEAYVKVTISEKSADPGDDPGTDPGSDQTPTESVPEAVGTAHKAGAGTYVVRSADTVWLTKVAKNRKSFTVPAGVNINGKIFAVTGINARAFKGTKVSGGRKKVKRQYVKKYRKIFTKKNAGRKVRVK